MTVRPNSIAGGGDAAGYYAADNYYTGEQEGPSEWGGGGAEETTHAPGRTGARLKRAGTARRAWRAAASEEIRAFRRW